MKATGAEIKEFYFNGWPKDYYHEDYEFNFEGDQGEWLLDPEKKYDLGECGFLIWDGDFDHVAPKGEEEMEFEEAFKKWKKTVGNKVFAVSVPEKDVEEFQKIMKEKKWKVT